jgi:hypothetical protein
MGIKNRFDKPLKHRIEGAEASVIGVVVNELTEPFRFPC